MKSIRWSLLLYFLVVLALAMGAVSFLVYQQAQETVRQRETAAAELIRKQHEENVKKERDKLDEKLLSQAHALADQVEVSFNPMRERFRATARVVPVASMFGAMPSATGSIMQAFVSMYWSVQEPFGEALHRSNLAELQINEQKVFRDADDSQTEYFQVDGNFGNARWRSPSMGSLSFRVDPKVFQPPLIYDSHAEDRELKPGLTVRCVSLKFALGLRGGRAERPVPPPGGGPRPDQPRSPERRLLVYVQCACDTSKRDQQLGRFDQQLTQDLADNESESQASLASLRARLLLISLLTFAIAVVGGYLLVWLGLYPLHRLSDAVSKVSARDFRLPLGDAPLPVELRPIVDRLTHTLDELKRAFAREKQAAADISHELRTPVASLLTTAEVALRKQRSADDYRQVIDDCHTIGQQMNRLIERLLALARLDAGVQTLRPRQVDVNHLAQECVDLVRPLAEAKQLKLQLERKGPVHARTDPDKLREVLTNLLHNAIQYNRPDGTVELSVGRNNGHLELVVRDTGVGISPEAREHIFERFYRADPSRHADGMNAGLGLAIVKGYIDLLGGSIAVESTPGKGSTFRVVLEKCS